MRDHDALNAEIKHAVETGAIVGLNAHHGGGGSVGNRLELGEEVSLEAGAVFEIDEDKIEARHGDDFGGEGGTEIQKAAKQDIVIENTVAKRVHA
jgi:hypothetical protein